MADDFYFIEDCVPRMHEISSCEADCKNAAQPLFYGSECGIIRIRELQVFAYHGVYEEENQKGQNFYVNADLILGTYEAGMKDELSLSVDYGEVCRFIYEWMRAHTFRLIEAVCEQLAQEILLTFSAFWAVEMEIRKPEAPIKLPFGSVSVAVKRGWHTVYLSVGSNLGDREKTIREALQKLDSCAHTRVIRSSDLIVTKPYGGVEQEDFLNGAVLVKTLLSPHRLLNFLHELENAAGRERIIRWGPRTLDLDILLYDDLVYEDEELVIPHADMENREFVLKPMCMIAPWKRHPIRKKTMERLLSELQGGSEDRRSAEGENP